MRKTHLGTWHGLHFCTTWVIFLKLSGNPSLHLPNSTNVEKILWFPCKPTMWHYICTGTCQKLYMLHCIWFNKHHPWNHTHHIQWSWWLILKYIYALWIIEKMWINKKNHKERYISQLIVIKFMIRQSEVIQIKDSY